MTEQVKEVKQVETAEQAKEVKEVKQVEVTSFESVEEIVSRLVKDKNNFLVTREIVGISAEYKTGANGNDYVNVWVSLDAPIKRIDVANDGSEKIIPLETPQMPMFSLLLPFRKHKFYRKFVDAIAAKIESEIHFSDDAKTATFLFSGIPVKVFGQFVASGAEEKNPFQRNAEPYAIKGNNRYVYHLVGVDLPTDDDTIEEYSLLKAEIRAAQKAAIQAEKEAEFKRAAKLKRVLSDIEEPF